ncbi:MAG: purine-nucleoside phosphorylase [Desulfuromonas sp.]|nr:MAG: purine-nucleoside phosphorylase [Desulfuromonas sp.]
MFPDLVAAVEFVNAQSARAEFDYAVILGSGLGAVVEAAVLEGEVAYRQLPDFCHHTVPGHAGKLGWGLIDGHRVLFFQGRFHLYQGLTVSQVVVPVVLAAQLGCRNILLTNASGAINPDFLPGEIVFVSDHINLTGENPLCGISPPPFLDLGNLYRSERYQDMRDDLEKSAIRLHQGVLAGLPGPTYETPAEIRMLKTCGADLVSMSTVHEALAAHFFRMQVTALSVVANSAAGLGDSELNHQEVLAVGRRSVGAVKEALSYLLRNI